MNPKQDRTERPEGGRNLNRREMIGLAGAAAGAIAGFSLLGCARSMLPVAKTGETVAKDGKKRYSLTTRAKDDIVVCAVAEPNKLAFDVKVTLGPRNKSMRIPLLSLPNDSYELSTEQKRQREAALHLLTVSGSFVTPQQITIVDSKTKGLVIVRFAFMGEEDPARRIRVVVKLEDTSGNSLAEIVHLCGDTRISAKETVVMGRGGRRFALRPSNNSEVFEFDGGLLSKIGQIAVTFEEVDEPNYPAAEKSPVS
jgi:hypothetical protein